ncbi:MAG: hypothetical protein DMF96_18985, partial [Acidobacteria bacterium]
MKRLVTICATVSLSFSALAPAQDIPPEYQQVLTTLAKQGDYKAMTKGTGGTDVMMGDLVLTEDEVNPVMSALLDNGLDVTALHNHFFWDEPRMFYMHVHGHGKPADLARKVKPALDLIGKSTTRPA